MLASYNRVVGPNKSSYFLCLLHRSVHGIHTGIRFQRVFSEFLPEPRPVRMNRILGEEVHTLTYMKTADNTGGIHAWSDVHCIAPDVILRFLRADNAWKIPSEMLVSHSPPSTVRLIGNRLGIDNSIMRIPIEDFLFDYSVTVSHWKSFPTVDESFVILWASQMMWS